MAAMVRKQIYVQKQQEILLKRLAKARRVSEAEIIREAIDQRLSGEARPFAPEPEAWAKALAFMQSLHARGPMADRPRTWKREDAYEDRLSRHERHSG